jgi:hypothetical protein
MFLFCLHLQLKTAHLSTALKGLISDYLVCRCGSSSQCVQWWDGSDWSGYCDSLWSSHSGMLQVLAEIEVCHWDLSVDMSQYFQQSTDFSQGILLCGCTACTPVHTLWWDYALKMHVLGNAILDFISSLISDPSVECNRVDATRNGQALRVHGLQTLSSLTTLISREWWLFISKVLEMKV